MAQAGLPEDLESNLRAACLDVVESMGRSTSFDLRPTDTDLDKMTERVCEQVFAGTPSSSGRGNRNLSEFMAQRFSQDRKLCPVVKSALLQQEVYQAPAPQHEHCASSVPQAARALVSVQKYEAAGTVGSEAETIGKIRRSSKAGYIEKTQSGVDNALLAEPQTSVRASGAVGYDAKTGGRVDNPLLSKLEVRPETSEGAGYGAKNNGRMDNLLLPKPEMSTETLKKAGYDAKTSSGVDSLTSRLNNEPKLPQFPPTWLMAQYAEQRKQTSAK